MEKNKTLIVAGVSIAVLATLYFILKPSIGNAQGRRTPLGPDPNDLNPPAPSPSGPDLGEGCPPTFYRCYNYAKTGKCYNPLLIDKATGLYPNGTNPCEDKSAAPQPSDYDAYGYGTNVNRRGLGIDDNVYR